MKGICVVIKKCNNNRRPRNNKEKISNVINEGFLKYWKESGYKTKTQALGKLAAKTDLCEKTIQNCLLGKHVSYKTRKKIEKELKLSDGILIYDTNSRNEIRKVKEQIRKSFFSLKPIEAFTLASYFDTYIKISDEALDLLIYYTNVNKNSKINIYKEILKYETLITIEDTMRNVEYVYDFQAISRLSWTEHEHKFNKIYYSSKYAKRKDKDHSMKKDLWDDIIDNRVKTLNLNDLHKLAFQTDCIFTMDIRDWEIVIAFELLSKKPLIMLSDEQQKLLCFAKQLFESEYNNDYTKI